MRGLEGVGLGQVDEDGGGDEADNADYYQYFLHDRDEFEDG